MKLQEHVWACANAHIRMDMRGMPFEEKGTKRSRTVFLASSKRNDLRRVRGAEGYHLQQLYLRLERNLQRSPPFPFSPFEPSLHSHCLSLRFTFSRRDGDGDVRFNKAPGMSCHVMHSIACEIYVNTPICSGEFRSLSLPSRTSRISGVWNPHVVRIKLLYGFLILILTSALQPVLMTVALNATCGWSRNDCL